MKRVIPLRVPDPWVGAALKQETQHLEAPIPEISAVSQRQRTAQTSAAASQ